MPTVPLQFAIACLIICSISIGNAILLPPGSSRRAFLEQAQSGLTLISTLDVSSLDRQDLGIATSSQGEGGGWDTSIFLFQQLQSELKAKQVGWDQVSSRIKNDKETTSSGAVQWSNLRYGSSSLTNDRKSRIPAQSFNGPTQFPSRMKGYWLVTYKFSKASFPQGRDKLTLRIPGAGLGTCLALPNVGYNPSPFVWRFLEEVSSSSDDGNKNSYAYEDVAYNQPRRFEAFWPQSKATSVQTSGISSTPGVLSPKCFVSGEGCTQQENPTLHSPSTRFIMEFSGPTRRGGYASQTTDVSMVGTEQQLMKMMDDEQFITSRQFVQYNVNQELQTFYKEIISLDVPSSNDNARKDKIVTGVVRVAAFLPPTENNLSGGTSNYSDDLSLALYDYKITLKAIEEEEAITL